MRLSQSAAGETLKADADTMRKIIAGGLLFDAASKESDTAKLLARLLGYIDRDSDKRLFEGWTLPCPPVTPITAAVHARPTLIQTKLSDAKPATHPGTSAEGRVFDNEPKGG